MNIVKVGDILKIKTGKYDANHGVENGKYTFFTCADVPSKANTYSFNDEVLILPGNGANVGNVYHYKGKLEAYQRTYVLHEINAFPRFLYYYFSKFWIRQITKRQVGSATNYIKMDDIVSFEIPLPPLKTQKQIANTLDEAAALRDKTVQLLKEYDLLAQSIFLDMFGDPVLNEKGWEIKTLIEVSNQITDGTHHSPKLVNEGFPYVTAKHIKKMSLEFDSKPTYVDKEAHDEIYSRCKPEYQDVFLIKDGATTGVACLNSFKEPISLLSSVGLIKPNKEVLTPVFLVFWFNHSGLKAQLIRKFMSGAAIKRYTISKMKKFKIIIPPIKLQNQFTEKIDLIEQQKELAKQELQESEDLFNCLLQKAFKGELV